MGRQEARAKGWNTFRENMIQYAKEHPEYFLEDFILQRADTAYNCWREARLAEKSRNFKKARGLYLKASECLEQAEKLTEHPPLTNLLEKLKTEYYDFVVQRDPNYRLTLKHPLLWIKDNPGILQTELYKLFPDHNREDMTYALYFAEKEGLIRREKKGRSYQLFFEREKADDPLLNIQDDETDIQEKAEQEAALRKGCLIFFVIIVWLLVFGIAFAFAGPVGAALAAAAFIAWLVIRKIRRKKQETPKEAPPSEAAPPPEQLSDNIEKNDEDKPV